MSLMMIQRLDQNEYMVDRLVIRRIPSGPNPEVWIAEGIGHDSPRLGQYNSLNEALDAVAGFRALFGYDEGGEEIR